ncbi:hypothetical protein [Aureispira anguillae]|uniref:Uncharacterized protein n=1 Tax=Aureispira anguillae TaxID=2864201 RepID=A0A915YIF2_9BACT|nr:hypothetical protein [Aureispira anguillae]BDS13754.1 hypothetical protein AsAng_0044950 [Aureispira anguillae]
MKTLIRTRVPLFTNTMRPDIKKNNSSVTIVNDGNDTAKPHQHSGQAPIGTSRSSDQNCLDGTLSFWQLQTQREHLRQQ